MPDFSVAIALLKKPIEDTYSKASGAIQKRIAIVRASNKVKALHAKLWQIQRVKTIWNTDRPLSLSSIYYPVSVQLTFPDSNDVRQVNSVDDLQHHHVVVYGTAGQGKSILMKYLVGKEIRSGKRIPLLCELRNILNSTLEDFLVNQFSLLLGMQPDASVFAAFAAYGNISFLLDGFDEIDDDNVQSVLQQIDVLSVKYPAAKIVITSRPNSDCRNLVSFNIVNVKPLGKDDLYPFYKKITKDNDFSAQLVKAIDQSTVQIQTLITTPLLATLLAISYKAAHKIPIEFSDFYEDLFQILLVRHDASKLGWRRKRSSGLNDRQIQQVFEAFCFSVKRKRLSIIDVAVARALVDESASNCCIPLDGHLFLEDVRKITCLITQEGKRIEFVHASVAQFFAAMYVKSRTEPQSFSFYSQLLNNHWKLWSGEIFFLEKIDSHRFKKYFAIPDLEKFIAYLAEDDASSTMALDRLLQGFFIRKLTVNGEKAEVRYYTANENSFSAYCTTALDKKIFGIIFSTSFDNSLGWVHGFNSDNNIKIRSYLDIVRDRGPLVYAAVSDAVKECLISCNFSLSGMREEVERAEHTTEFISL